MRFWFCDCFEFGCVWLFVVVCLIVFDLVLFGCRLFWLVCVYCFWFVFACLLLWFVCICGCMFCVALLGFEWLLIVLL